MPTSATSVGAASALILLASVGAAGAGVVDLPQRLEESLKNAVGEALNNMNARWLDFTDGRGYAEDGKVRRLRIMADPASIQGSMEVDPIVVTQGPGAEANLTGIEAVRDEDGSLEDGVLTPDDLVRFQVTLAEPIPDDTDGSVRFHHPDGPPVDWQFTTPADLDHGWNELY